MVIVDTDDGYVIIATPRAMVYVAYARARHAVRICQWRERHAMVILRPMTHNGVAITRRHYTIRMATRRHMLAVGDINIYHTRYDARVINWFCLLRTSGRGIYRAHGQCRSMMSMSQQLATTRCRTSSWRANMILPRLMFVIIIWLTPLSYSGR